MWERKRKVVCCCQHLHALFITFVLKQAQSGKPKTLSYIAGSCVSFLWATVGMFFLITLLLFTFLRYSFLSGWGNLASSSTLRGMPQIYKQSYTSGPNNIINHYVSLLTSYNRVFLFSTESFFWIIYITKRKVLSNSLKMYFKFWSATDFGYFTTGKRTFANILALLRQKQMFCSLPLVSTHFL